jgi:hypothetical protein
MAAAIVNPRVLNISRPNARLRNRQRIVRARMGYVTPPPVIAVPAPAEMTSPVLPPDDSSGEREPEAGPEDIPELLPEPVPDEPAPDAPPSAPPEPEATPPDKPTESR